MAYLLYDRAVMAFIIMPKVFSAGFKPLKKLPMTTGTKTASKVAVCGLEIRDKNIPNAEQYQ